MNNTLFGDYGIEQVAIFDFETTGLVPTRDYPIELSVVTVDLFGTTKEYSSLIKLPKGVRLPLFITDLTGLTEKRLEQDGKDIDIVAAELSEFIGDTNTTLFVGHNVNFDLGFLAKHLFMEPKHFMCTRSIEIINNPHLNASLQAVYSRMYENPMKQTHRALDDVKMTLAVFGKQIDEIGGSISFFKNVIVSMPDRPLAYKPPFAKVKDFTEKYVSRKVFDQSTKDINELKEKLSKYSNERLAEEE